ncbi:MAG: PAS domain S-box protein [Candidatus Rifleibacteriota bacterium]
MKEILEQSLAGYWDWHIPSGYEYLSPSFKKMFGYEDHEIENRADSWQKLIFQEDLPGVFEKFNQHVETRGSLPYYNEVRYHHKNGSTVWVICTGKIIEWDADGKPLRMVGCHINISGLKQAEVSLQESEKRFHELFEKAPLGYQSLDSEGRFIEVNNTWLETLGYKREEVIGKWFGDFLAPEYKQAFRERFPVFKAQGKIHSEFFMLHKDGNKRYIAFDGRIGHNPDGTFRQTHCILKDETERKKWEDSLRISEEKYRVLFENAGDAIFIHDFNGRLLAVNRLAHERLGYTESELMAKTIMEIDAPDHAVHAPDRIERLSKFGQISFETVHQRKDGSRLPLEVSSRRIMWEGQKAMLSICRDVSERRKMEDQLRQSEANYRMLTDNTPDFIYMLDKNSRHVAVSKSLCEALHKKADEIVGKNHYELGFPHEKAQEWQSWHREVFSSKKPVRQETSTLMPDGRIHTYEVLLLPVTDPSGEVIRIWGTRRDVTDRRLFEETVHRQQKLESLGLLAGGIAHDFNNLLGGIFGNIDLASEESNDKKKANYLAKALSTIDRARALTGQLLTFAKGGSPIKRIDKLIPFIEESANFATSGSNVTCHCNIPVDLWQCSFDKNQIGQVIDNIVINAQHAMPEGGTIEITAQNIHLIEKSQVTLAPGNYVKIAFKDHGIGMPQEILPKIFDPFFTTKAKGHGLGLATCFSIIKRHGGCIDVESAPGKGSTFTVFIPATPESSSGEKATISEGHTGSGTFLIMDDEETIRDLLASMLESMGYKVICVINSKQALEEFARKDNGKCRFVAVFLDLTIPGDPGGKETIKKIREIDQFIPAFVASGYADDPVMASPTRHGFNGSISKPFTKAELEQLLNKHLKK